MTSRRSVLGALLSAVAAPVGLADLWRPKPIVFNTPLTARTVTLPTSRLYRLVWIDDDGSPNGRIVATALVRGIERPGNMETRGRLDIVEWLEGSDTVGMPYVNKGEGGPRLRKDWWLEET